MPSDILTERHQIDCDVLMLHICAKHYKYTIT